MKNKIAAKRKAGEGMVSPPQAWNKLREQVTITDMKLKFLPFIWIWMAAS
jgi:hypothetical protein